MVYRYRTSHSGRTKSSVHPPVTQSSSGHSAGAQPGSDARQRILDAAVDLYGSYGFNGVTIKEIAVQAGVSAPLVIHHFGSKAALRKACDRYVADAIHRTKSESVRIQGPMPRNYVFEMLHANRHLMKYLLRAFIAGGEEVDALFDKLVEDSLEYTAEAEEVGLVYPSAHPRHRAVVMLLQSFGALMLHHQMKRHLGASPVDGPPEGLLPYISAVMELYTQPVINGEMYQELMESQLEFERRAETAAANSNDHHGPAESDARTNTRKGHTDARD